MIRIHILTEDEEQKLNGLAEIREAERKKLEELISLINADWLIKAKEKTALFNKAGYYNEEKGKESWGEIKQVYMDLQANKCAYCEQKLEDKPIWHDVEHYRPKKNVKVWLNKKRKKEYSFTFLDEKSKGYHLLPYNILNYATACKHCNSSLKSDCFPIAGNRVLDLEDFDTINNTEKPFLPYPLGHLDDDSPEELISFNGVSPIINPQVTDAHKRLRAEVTIKFFNLDALRESLIRQRCKVIKDIFEAVHIINTSGDEELVDTKKEDLKIWLDDKSEHTNCARSFFHTCLENFNIAKEYYKTANDYLKKHPQK